MPQRPLCYVLLSRTTSGVSIAEVVERRLNVRAAVRSSLGHRWVASIAPLGAPPPASAAEGSPLYLSVEPTACHIDRYRVSQARRSLGPVPGRGTRDATRPQDGRSRTTFRTAIAPEEAARRSS